MSLGENLQFLRKRNNITQEELAEKLEVSRQSVSKWESDNTYPEMDKLIQLSQMFHCRIDDLIQKDISKLYVEDRSHYDEHMNLFSKMMSLGVGLILLGISVMSFLVGIGIGANNSINEGISTIAFFIFLIIAVAILIVMELQHSAFEKKNPHIENFYSQDEIDNYNKKFSVMIASGVVLILIGVIILIGTEAFLSEINQNSPYDFEGIFASIFFLFIAVAVMLLVYAGLQKGKYNIEEYNVMHDKESAEYKKSQITGRICACLMLIATIIYLILGFVFDEWGMPAVVVFPVFGIGCGIASIIVDKQILEK